VEYVCTRWLDEECIDYDIEVDADGREAIIWNFLIAKTVEWVALYMWLFLIEFWHVHRLRAFGVFYGCR